MKVILVHKSREDASDPLERRVPHGLYSIATLIMDNGIDCELLNLSNHSSKDASELILSKNPDIAAFSVFTLNRKVIIKLAKDLKDSNPEIKIVIGGPHATPLYEEILKRYRFIDYILLYEGEYSFLALIKALDIGKDIGSIKNIAYIKDSKIVITEKDVRIDDLDNLPIPAKYFKYDSLIFSRGCPGQCIYCSSPVFWGPKIKFRSADNIIAELEMLITKYGITKFHFWDDTFFIDRKLVIETCRKIIEKKMNIMWDCSARVNLLDTEVLRLAKNAGCYSIYLGMESGSKDILKNIKKYTTPDQLRNASRLIRDSVMEFHYFVIVGSPGESNQTIKESQRLIKETKPHEVLVSKLHVDPGTELYNICKTKGVLDDNFWFESDSGSPIYTVENDEDTINRWRDEIGLSFRKDQKSFLFTEDEIKNNLKYLEENGGNPAYNYFLLGSYNLQNKDIKRAEQMFRKSVESNPGFAPSYSNLALISSMKGEFDKALEYFRKTSIMDPFNARTHINLSLTYQKLGEYKKAIESMKNAIEIDPLRNEELLKKIKESTDNLEPTGGSYSYTFSYG